MFAKIEPRVLAVGLIVVTLAYFVFPFDLFPDFMGLPGRIDDLLLAAWAAWFYRSRVQFSSESGSTSGAGRRAGSESGPESSEFDRRAEGREGFDPYAILEIDRSASNDAIKAAYRARMGEYHPDKVAHLGEALQEVAHEKSQEIQRAYQLLKD